MYRADSKRPPPVRSAEHLKAAEYEFRREDIDGQRVRLYEDRLKDGWEENSAHLFYQIIQFCHCVLLSWNASYRVNTVPAVITCSKQTPPPWKALSEDPTKLIADECLPGGLVRFGSSPEKTLREHRNSFIRHWFSVVGYLEFHHHYGRGGTFVEPDSERWHALAKYERAFTEQWLSNERTPRGKASSKPDTGSAIATVNFGSRGPKVSLDDQSPYSSWKVLQMDEPLGRLSDPDDHLRHDRAPHRPGLPSWPAPCLVPDTIYARLQWSSQFLEETEGQAAATLLQGVKWLAQLPVGLAFERVATD